MLEIIILFILCRSIKRITEAKELNSYRYITYTILLWFGFEALFWVLGLVFFRVPLVAYLLAFMGATLGGYIAHRIALRATPTFTDYEEIQ